MALTTPYKNLWFSTDELVRRFKPSISNVFDVYIKGSFGAVSNTDINFLAYDAVLPGTSYELGQVFGDRQGRTEQYPTKRVYPQVDVSFYIDADYKVLQFFEQWMATISPNIGSPGTSYTKFSYADSYEREIVITKFERLFREPNQRLVENGVYGPPKNYVEYTLRNAYPTNLIAVPVSYEGSNVLRTTVTFNYDVYNFKRVNDGIGTDENGGGTVRGPGGDSTSQNAQVSSASQTNILGNSQEELERIRGAAALASIAQSRNANKLLSGNSASQNANAIVDQSYNRVLYGSPNVPD